MCSLMSWKCKHTHVKTYDIFFLLLFILSRIQCAVWPNIEWLNIENPTDRFCECISKRVIEMVEAYVCYDLMVFAQKK